MFKQPRKPRMPGVMRKASGFKQGLMKNRMRTKKPGTGFKTAKRVGLAAGAVGLGAGALALRKRGIRPGVPRSNAIRGATRPRQLAAAPRQLTPRR